MMFDENTEIWVSEKGAAYLALRDSALLNSEEDDRFEDFWEKYNEYRTEDVIRRIDREGKLCARMQRQAAAVAAIGCNVIWIAITLITRAAGL